MGRKRERSGEDNQVEWALKIWFSKVHKKNVPINGPNMCQKVELWTKISLQLMEKVAKHCI